MDHHCPWVSNCIGKLNHSYFVVLLLLTELYGAFIIATSLSALANEATIYGEVLIVAF
jgi:hypothetical protein